MSTSIYIAIPAFGGLQQAANARCVTLLTHGLQKLGVGWALDHELHESLVQRARNSLVSRFLKSTATHLLFIDADITFDVAAVLGMLAADKPLVCGAYPRKAIVWQQVVDAVQRKVPDVAAHAASFVVNVLPPPPGETEVTLHAEDGCVPVMEAATGFMLVRREVFEQMAAEHPEWMYYSDAEANRGEAMFAFFDCAIEDGRYLSEDWLFSRRWQRAGGTVWLFLPAVLGHIGTYTYRGDLFKTFQPVAEDGQVLSRQAVEQVAASESSLPADNTPEYAALMLGRYEWAAKRVKGDNIADVCCGPGYGMPILSHAGMGGTVVHGFDRDPKNKSIAYDQMYGDVVTCDVMTQTFDGYDAVVSIEAMEHLTDPVKFLRRLWSSVKELVMTVPITPTKHKNEYHLTDWCEDGTLMLLQALGWEVKEHEVLGDNVLAVYAVRA